MHADYMTSAIKGAESSPQTLSPIFLYFSTVLSFNIACKPENRFLQYAVIGSRVHQLHSVGQQSLLVC